MKIILSVISAGIALALFASASWADGHLAKSGTINYHTGWGCPSTMTQPAEGVMIGTGTCVGVTYNDNGS